MRSLMLMMTLMSSECRAGRSAEGPSLEKRPLMIMADYQPVAHIAAAHRGERQTQHCGGGIILGISRRHVSGMDDSCYFIRWNG